MKRLLLLVLVLGATELSLQAQCWFPNVVYALPNDQLTIGAPDANAGRTVCYKWSSSDCNNCIAGPTDGPTLNVHMPSEPGSYHFTVKKISDRVQSCTVTVVVEEDIEIVSVTPKKNCYSEGDAITEDQFDIVTNPPGLQRHVQLDQYSRIAHCSNIALHTCQQPLTFNAYKRNEVRDSKTINVMVYTSELISVEAPASVLMIQSHIREAKDLLAYVNRTNKQISSALSRVPGPVRFETSPFGVDCIIGSSFGICCDGKTGQSQASLSVTVSGGGSWWIYCPMNMLPIPGFQLIPPSVQLEGRVGFSISGTGSITTNTCDETSFDININPAAYFSGGISWGRHGDILYGSAALFCEPSISGVWHVLPLPMDVSAHGYIKGGLELTYRLWSSDDRTIRFTWLTLQMW